MHIKPRAIATVLCMIFFIGFAVCGVVRSTDKETSEIRQDVYKRQGYDVKLNLNEVKATVVDGKTHVHLDIDADLEKDELTKILKSIGL